MFSALSESVGPNVMWFVGSGEHNLHFTQHVRIRAARGYNYESFGMMGADVPCAVGYAVAQALEGSAGKPPFDDARFSMPARSQANLIAVVTGDGCLLRSLGCLATIAGNRLPIFILVINNGGAGQVRWVHEHLHPGRPDICDVPFVDFTSIAAAAGLRSVTAEAPTELVAIWNSFRDDRLPTLCEVRAPRDDHPHVAMQVRRRMGPKQEA
jgi:thiamine pyrophosphate-dependent acetolactate synthase large subunit-like protein